MKELDPFSMPCVQLVLAIDVRQSLVILTEYKRLGLEIMILMLQSPHNGVKFLITDVVDKR